MIRYMVQYTDNIYDNVTDAVTRAYEVSRQRDNNPVKVISKKHNEDGDEVKVTVNVINAPKFNEDRMPYYG